MKGELIGAFVNAWRGRHVQIFADTENPAMVYTEGRPIEDTAKIDRVSAVVRGRNVWPPATVETHEPRVLYTQYIGSYSKVYE